MLTTGKEFRGRTIIISRSLVILNKHVSTHPYIDESCGRLTLPMLSLPDSIISDDLELLMFLNDSSFFSCNILILFACKSNHRWIGNPTITVVAFNPLYNERVELSKKTYTLIMVSSFTSGCRCSWGIAFVSFRLVFSLFVFSLGYSCNFSTNKRVYFCIF